jgi:phosphonate transport system substrate-binding protein
MYNAQSACRAWGKWLVRSLAMAWCIGPGGASAENAAIEIGIIPTLSTRTILATYQPLREYLEARMHQPVVLMTAPDYRTFIDRTQHGEYRFVITAPHFARLAQLEAGYVPMVRVKRELRGILVVRTDSVIKTVNDLRGKSVSTPENIAVISMLGQQLLHSHGLEPGKTITVRPSPSFNSAVLAVQNRESDAAFTAQTALNQMSAETHSLLRTIASTDAVPHNIFLASKQVPPKEVERMTRLLLEFTEDKSRGIPFFEQTGFLGYVRPSAAELKVLDPYVTELKRQLAVPETPPNRKP